jgi:hypothetical protein
LKVFTNFLTLLTLLVLVATFANAQETIVRGKVTDAGTGDPIPFVNVVFKGTGTGATTDFDGNFNIRTTKPTDSVLATYIGYKPRAKAIRKGVNQVLNFQLEEEVTHLQEVVVKAGENPAFGVLRGVVDNKSKNDKKFLTAYEYEAYTKSEVDIDHITDKFREKKLMKKIAAVLDSIDRVVGEDGKPILPLFITESVSKVYFRDNPQLRTEHILKTKINGVGLDDGSMVTQLVGSTFQEYNFYQNWLTIINKNFVSPIADGWRLYYDYDLLDSVMVGNDFCYYLDFYPKNPHELAFTGSMWITKKNFALKRIDVTVGNQANINFIDKIKIQQELTPTDQGPWIPVKNRVLIDVGEITKNSVGLLAKFYTSNKNIIINQPKPTKFYEKRIDVAEEAQVEESDTYWDSLRHEPLTQTEKSVYSMIDTLKNIPIVKSYTELFKALVDGYYDLGKIEVGPYLRTIAYNNIEGVRLQGGFKTNRHYSKKMIYSGFLAYGFNDARFKFSAQAQRILERKRWTTATVRIGTDMIRLGIDEEALNATPLFLTAARWGNFRRGYYFDEAYTNIQRELFKGFTGKASFRYWTFDPTFNFGYLSDPSDINSPVLSTVTATELAFEGRYVRDETFIQNGNERVSLGLKKWPAITLRYTRGIPGLFGSDYGYNKLRINVDKRLRLGPLGVGFITVTGEKIFETLPYPLLAVHLGNQSPIYSQFTYNLMNFGEFTSDTYASLRYRQYFEGFLVNKIPLLNQLDLRLTGTANIIYGSLSESNRNLIYGVTPDGRPTARTGYFTGTPYVELGYGVENILKIFRVDFVHRLTYLDPVGNNVPRRFGILFTVQFKL